MSSRGRSRRQQSFPKLCPLTLAFWKIIEINIGEKRRIKVILARISQMKKGFS